MADPTELAFQGSIPSLPELSGGEWPPSQGSMVAGNDAVSQLPLSQNLQSEPLDMSTFAQPAQLGPGSAQPSPVQPLAAVHPSLKGKLAGLAPLLALIPIAASKGGQLGVAALLNGFHQAGIEQQGQARQAAIDQRAQTTAQSQDAYRRAQALNLDSQRKLQFLHEFAAGAQTIDNEDALRSYVQLNYGMADRLGIPRSDLNSYIQSTQTPSALQARQARKRIADLRTQFGEKWVDYGPRFSYALPGAPIDPQSGQPQTISFEELLRRAGYGPVQQPAAGGSTAFSPLPTRGGGSDYQRFLERWAASNHTTPATMTADQELAARAAFAKAGSVRQPAVSRGGPRPGGLPRDDPKFPAGVQDYLITLRQRGLSRDDAESEVFDRAWSDLRAAHPHLDAQRVQQAITRLFSPDGSAALVPVGAGRGGGASASSLPSAAASTPAANASTPVSPAPAASLGTLSPGVTYRWDPATGSLVAK